MLLNEHDSRALCEQILSAVQGEDAEVTLRSTLETNQRFAANAFTTNGQTEEIRADLTVWNKGKRGGSATTELSKDGLRRLTQDAEEVARLSPPDQEYVPTLGPQKFQAVQAFFPSATRLSLAHRSQGIANILAQCEKERVVGAGLHRTTAAAQARLTRNGNFTYHQSSVGSLSMTARTPDGSSSGYFLRSHPDPEKIPMDQVAREAIRRAVEGRNPQTLAPGVYPVILEAQAVSDVLSYFPGAFSARPADEGRSAMSGAGGKTKQGESVFDPQIQLYSDPWNADLPAPPFTGDGLPAEKFHLIREGKVENLVYSRYWAKEKDRTATPGPVNFIMAPSGASQSLSELIAGSDRALLITRLWYIRMVNPRSLLVTGLTRDGVWLVENGKIKHPVRNFRFNQSLMQMLGPGNIEAVGPAERVGGAGSPESAWLVPALKLKRFHFTSPSEAV